MLEKHSILAVVPARSGSKGIPDKNMKTLQGISLIGHAGKCLAELKWLDKRIISTDSSRYAEEAKKYGLDVPFIRPVSLSDDRATAVDTMVHALEQCEDIYQKRFDILLLIEPTSPLRMSKDITNACMKLIQGGYDSVVCVSLANTKSHPLKMLTLETDKLDYYDSKAKLITARQQLMSLYVRNGVCYGVTRKSLLGSRAIITSNTTAHVIKRNLANIDDPIDLAWAEFLLDRNL